MLQICWSSSKCEAENAGCNCTWSVFDLPIECRYITENMSFFEIISSLFSCLHPLAGYQWLKCFHHSFILCRIFLVHVHKLWILCKPSLNNLEPNMHVLQFFNNSHPPSMCFMQTVYSFSTYNNLKIDTVIYIVLFLCAFSVHLRHLYPVRPY